MAKKEVAIRKRQQIAKANRMMFTWIAGVSIVVGFAIVGSIFLFQTIKFNSKVLGQKTTTAETLKANNKNVSALMDNVRLLQTNQDLQSARAVPDEQSVRVVLDALPADANTLALGASLQRKLLADVPGLQEIVSLSVGASDADIAARSTDTTGLTGPQEIPFGFEVSGSYDAIKEVTARLERSIRTMNVKSAVVQMNGGILTLTVQGVAYYQPPTTVELKDKPVTP